MSKSSSTSIETTWGTPESHWPFRRPVAEIEPEERERFRALTPDQRVRWLLMMLRLLEKQFGHLVENPRPVATGRSDIDHSSGESELP